MISRIRNFRLSWFRHPRVFSALRFLHFICIRNSLRFPRILHVRTLSQIRSLRLLRIRFFCSIILRTFRFCHTVISSLFRPGRITIFFRILFHRNFGRLRLRRIFLHAKRSSPNGCFPCNLNSNLSRICRFLFCCINGCRVTKCHCERTNHRGAHQLGAFVAHHCFINHFRFLLFNLHGQKNLFRTNKYRKNTSGIAPYSSV